MRFDFKTRTGLVSTITQGAQAFPGILNLYPTAQAAYSLRLLDTSYTGAAIRVRRSSDNTESDIGFNSLSGLDTATLLTFVGSGNGFVNIWYDQSGNGQNATQTTAANQPIIVSSGTVETQLGKPSVKFNRVTGFGLTTSVTIQNIFSIIGVMSQDLTTLAPTRIFASTNATNNSLLVIRRSDNISIFISGITVLPNFTLQVSNTAYLISLLRQSTTTNIYQNNSTVANSSSSTAIWGGFQMSTPTFATSESFAGKISEVIIYPVNQNSNISGIHSNINNYYTIY